MAKIDEQISRMKGLMNFGIVENKQNSYNHLEYSNEGADGKLYGIVREGTKFFIKQASKPKDGKQAIVENFDYIGGWMNRKDNQYSSYADCLKNFDLKMMSLRESCGNKKGVVVESLDPNKKEILAVQGTKLMKEEIARQKQIMLNASVINEGQKKAKPINEKAVKECGASECGVSECGDMEDVDKSQKPNMKNECSPKFGKGAKYCKGKKCKNGKCKCSESTEVLGFNRANKDYMDTSHGTEIGSSSPFNKKANDGKNNHSNETDDESEMKNGVVEGKVNEDVATKEPSPIKGHYSMDDGLPETAGVGEVGDGKPFEKKAKANVQEATDLDDDDLEDTDDDTEINDDEMPQMSADEDEISNDDNDDMDDDDSEVEIDMDGQDDDISSKLDDIMSRLDDLESKIDDSDYDDDELYSDDDEDNDDANIEIDMDEPYESEDNEDYDNNMPMESRRYRGRRVNEDRLNVWGKHPAYQKKVMTLPKSQHQEFPDYNVWDEDIPNDRPYGGKIGRGIPFEKEPDAIDNSIEESITKILGRKKK
jgi:hypothetical protein